ncbi:MAG: SDR family oxidoreductase [Gammaproteobacteria bacterium]|nr:SDR family oxidoreductase [Gammaproteobacteria bacterium]
MKLLLNKVAIVTGAAHPMGMGFAAGLKLAQAGAKVILTDLGRNEQELETLEQRVSEISELGGNAIAMAVDITERSQIDACVEKVIERYGQIDILFNNAGSPAGCGEFLNMTDQQWDISYQVNVKGTADFCQAVIPVMIENGNGSIINNSSLSGLAAIENMAAYTATKFAVVGLTKALACEFGKNNIRVNSVCPGNIWTQMGQIEAELLQKDGQSIADVKKGMSAKVPLGRCGVSEDVANAVVYLASDMASYVSGVAMPVSGGMAPGL